MTIASQYSPHKIIGLDIDNELVGIARKNIKHYKLVNKPIDGDKEVDPSQAVNEGSKDGSHPIFPNNVEFVHEDYVPKTDNELNNVKSDQFDTILCLSVTKWVHLNYRDDGLMRSFKKMYAQLKPGGRLILEPQPWSSYRNKRKLTVNTCHSPE